MMTIKKNLAKTDLNQFKTAPKEHFIKEVLRYRLWSTNKALDQINYAPFKYNTAKQYFDQIVTYVNHGNSKFLSTQMCKLVDKYLNSGNIVPLEPKTADKRLNSPHVSLVEDKEIPQVTNRTVEAITQFVYAVKIDNHIIYYNTEKEIKAFVDGFKMGCPDRKINVIHIDKKWLEVDTCTRL